MACRLWRRLLLHHWLGLVSCGSLGRSHAAAGGDRHLRLRRDGFGRPHLRRDRFGRPHLRRDRFGRPHLRRDRFGRPHLRRDRFGRPHLRRDSRNRAGLVLLRRTGGRHLYRGRQPDVGAVPRLSLGLRRSGRLGTGRFRLGPCGDGLPVRRLLRLRLHRLDRGRRRRRGWRRRGWRRRRRRRRRWRRLQQAVALRPSPDPVGLGLDNARGMRLHSDAERDAKIERLLICQSELFGELMDADLAWQRMPPSGPAGAATRPGNAPRAQRPRLPKPSDLARLHVSPQGPYEGAAVFGQVEAGNVLAQPGTPPRA